MCTVFLSVVIDTHPTKSMVKLSINPVIQFGWRVPHLGPIFTHMKHSVAIIYVLAEMRNTYYALMVEEVSHYKVSY